MHIRLSALALAATTFLAPANALDPADIPVDLPVSSLLTSAQSHLSRGETSNALVYYDAAIARDPSNYLTFFKRATTYLSLGRHTQATDDFIKVLSIKPNFEGAHLQLAKIKARAADWDGAKTQYQSGSRGPTSIEVKELEEARLAADLAAVAEKNEQWDECVTNAGTAIMVASRSPHLRELRARCRFKRGDVEGGIGDLQHVLNLKPGDTTPHLVISATTFYVLGDMKGGMAQVRKCLHSDPDSKTCKKLHKQEKAVEKAHKKILGQLSRNQVTTAGRSLMGTGDELGFYPEIQKQVDDLMASQTIPTNARIRLLEDAIEMTCQAYTESNHKEAPKHCEHALNINPDSFWGLLYQGKKQVKEELFEAAIQSFEKAAEAHPDLRGKVTPLLQNAQIALKRSKTKDYYKVLGVPNNADERQIKSAYRRASKQYHPDKAVGISKEEAEKKMAAINEAYEVLSDPELRARFDRGDDPNSQEPRGNPFGGHPFGGGFGGHPVFQQGGQHFKFQFGG
ncbi:hypothetical protein BGZ63DRAFT_376418 [Mariannaea sp. PMI_226]|nr:hypothetical protein BGZ63DRAFT_376418 [Mariannaea sp. PMI_226]